MNRTIMVYNRIYAVVKFLGKKLKLENLLPKTGRPRAISYIDSISLALFKQKNGIETKKRLYEIFELPCSYNTLVENLSKCAPLAAMILAVITRLNRKDAHAIKHTDSTDIPVCLVKNAKHHKTMRVLSDWGRTGKGWFYGLKLHITTDLKRKILSIGFSRGNTHDTQMFLKLNKDLAGIFVADAAYISKKLQREFFQEHRRILFAKPRKNMKMIMTWWQSALYDTRMLIELNFRNLKMFYGLVTSLPRSVNGYIANYLYAILAYMIA